MDYSHDRSDERNNHGDDLILNQAPLIFALMLNFWRDNKAEGMVKKDIGTCSRSRLNPNWEKRQTVLLSAPRRGAFTDHEKEQLVEKHKGQKM